MYDHDDAEFRIELNGRNLDNTEYYWDSSGRLTLKFPRPAYRKLTFKEMLIRFFTGRWRSLNELVQPLPDFVVIENWAQGKRDMYISGSVEFSHKVTYEGDL